MKEGSILQYFSPISILLGLAISILQLYVTSKQAKLKETIMELFRKEMKSELDEREDRIQKDVDFKIRIVKAEIIQELRK